MRGLTRFRDVRTSMAVLSTIVVFILAAVSGCEFSASSPGNGGQNPERGSSGASIPSRGSSGVPNPGSSTGSGCAQPGSVTRTLLPDLSGDQIKTVAVDPCLKFAQLADRVLSIVPAGQRNQLNTSKFPTQLRSFANKVIVVNGAAECAYKTDRLAIGIYQHEGYLWSVGVVAVIRGELPAAVLETGTCLLMDKIPFPLGGQQFLHEERDPEPEVCADHSTVRRGTQKYTLMWLGSSDRMCQQLANTFTGS